MAYGPYRQSMLDSLRQVLPRVRVPLNNMETRKNKKQIVKILIEGIKDDNKDYEIFEIASRFIIQSKRFEY